MASPLGRPPLGKKGNYVMHTFGTSLLIRVISVAYSSDILDALEHCTNHQITPILYRGYTFAHIAGLVDILELFTI